jgi:hypothetical protein
VRRAVVRPAREVWWVVETRGVTLVRRDGDMPGAALLSIPYPYAALWALIADGRYTPQRARRMMALVSRADEGQAERGVERALAMWQGMGLVIRE